MPTEESTTGTGLTDEESAAIDAIFEQRFTATHYDLLGVSQDADRKAIRDAYFGLSKRFHPDVFFKRDLGAHKQKLDDVFRALTRAYDILSNARQRAGYDLHLASLRTSSVPPAPTATAPRSTLEPPAPAASAPRPSPQPPPTDVPATAPHPVVAPVTARHTPTPMATPSVPSGTRSTGSSSSTNMVVPPRLRGQTAPQPAVPPSATSPTPPVDPALRQRAMEAMARRLGNGVPRRLGADAPGGTGPVHAVTDSAAAAEERRARAIQLVHHGEEAQKRGDLVAALESFKAAGELNKGDETIRARVEAVSQLVNTLKVNDCIEQAREAMRSGHAEQAAKLWEQAWQGRPTDTSLLLNAAETTARHTKDYKRAAELAQRALMIDGRQVKGYLVLASVFIDAGLRASARGAIENAARIDPNNTTLKELRDRLGPPTIAEQLGLRNR